MTSNINTQWPVAGNPTTQSVRDNFATAKTEIEALQTGKENTGIAAAAISAHIAEVDPHSQYTTASEAALAAPVQSVSGRTGAVTLTKSDVGLASVDNTSDASKPISTATQAALNGKENTGTAAAAVAAHEAAGDPHPQYQGHLVSGTNIKTVNSTSLLGSGNVAVQAPLVSGTNIKTVNSTSLLGSGDVSVQPTLVSGTNIKTINSTSLLGSGNLTVGDVTLAGTQTLTNKTLTDPKISLGGTNGTAGQVPLSRGSGLSPVWSSVSTGERDFTVSGEKVFASGVVALNDDGSVSPVKQTITPANFTANYSFHTGPVSGVESEYLRDDKFVVAYINPDDSFGYITIGVVSGDSVTYSSPVKFSGSHAVSSIRLAALSASNVAIAYTSTSDSGIFACVSNVANSPIEPVSIAKISGAGVSVNEFDLCALNSVSLVVVREAYSPLRIEAFVATYNQNTGGMEANGTHVIVDQTGTEPNGVRVTALSSTEAVIAYTANTYANHGAIHKLNISGSDISVGNKAIFHGGVAREIDIATISPTKVVIAFADYSGSGAASLVVADVNEAAFTFGQKYTDYYQYALRGSVSHFGSGQIAYSFRSAQSSNIPCVVFASVIGLNVTGARTILYFDYGVAHICSAMVGNNRIIVNYSSSSLGAMSRIASNEITSTNADKWIGIAKNTALIGTNTTVSIVGSLASRAGVSAGKHYYLSDTGAVTTAVTPRKFGFGIGNGVIQITGDIR